MPAVFVSHAVDVVPYRRRARTSGVDLASELRKLRSRMKRRAESLLADAALAEEWGETELAEALLSAAVLAESAGRSARVTAERKPREQLGPEVGPPEAALPARPAPEKAAARAHAEWSAFPRSIIRGALWLITRPTARPDFSPGRWGAEPSELWFGRSLEGLSRILTPVRVSLIGAAAAGKSALLHSLINDGDADFGSQSLLCCRDSSSWPSGWLRLATDEQPTGPRFIPDPWSLWRTMRSLSLYPGEGHLPGWFSPSVQFVDVPGLGARLDYGTEGLRAVAYDTGPWVPHQLPSCVQFVYADIGKSELGRVGAASRVGLPRSEFVLPASWRPGLKPLRGPAEEVRTGGRRDADPRLRAGPSSGGDSLTALGAGMHCRRPTGAALFAVELLRSGVDGEVARVEGPADLRSRVARLFTRRSATVLGVCSLVVRTGFGVAETCARLGGARSRRATLPAPHRGSPAPKRSGPGRRAVVKVRGGHDRRSLPFEV
ncbi:hypothetical protein [Lentzea sp. NPDC003310]|uniref:hypothetical protein n=1 Tax=Lentzea sp. NPDC003310 TaxID=3154447 RepID=UPI0033B6C63A